MTTAPARGIIVGMYVCIYVSLNRVYHTLVLEIRVHPEMLHVFWYIDVLTCMIYNNCMHSTEHQEQPLLAMKIIDEDRYG